MSAARKTRKIRPLIQMKGLTFTRSQRHIVEDIDLAIMPNEIVTLLGPNGAGKTTLARLVLGLENPSSGRIERRRSLTIGYVPQRFAVDRTLPMTVRRFLRLSQNATEDEMRAQAKEIGIEHLLGQQLHALSGGELQRILLARALLRKPELLVLDEPSQGLDFNGQVELYNLIGRLRRDRHCAILVISHDLHLVMAATDRVLCLNHHICCQGSPEDVSRNKEYLALFGPRATDALAVYSHHHDHKHDITGEIVRIAGRHQHH